MISWINSRCKKAAFSVQISAQIYRFDTDEFCETIRVRVYPSYNKWYRQNIYLRHLLCMAIPQGIVALLDDSGSVTRHLVERDFPGVVVAIIEPLQINSLDT